MWIPLTLMVAAAAVVSSASIAAEPALRETCIGRISGAATASAARQAHLRYRCLALRNGQHVLVGEAGASDADTVLLVHGLGNNAHHDWWRVVPALATQYHVVTLDLPGFGGSPGTSQAYSFSALGATLAEVLNNTAPDRRVHVVGHSLGATISLYFAHVYPARVDRLVLVDAAGILLKSVFAQYIVSVRTPQIGILPVDRFLKRLGERIDGYRRNVFSNLDDRFDVSRWLLDNPEVRYALFGHLPQVDAAIGLVEHDFTSAIRETTAMTNVIWGADDRVAPLRTGKLLAGRMPNAQLTIIGGVGHAPMLESPETFNRVLLEALTAPLQRGSAGPAEGPSQGSVVCENRAHAHYSGVFDDITLDRCESAHIEGARLKRLMMKSSSLTIENSVIDSADVALAAQDSEVVATNLTLRGRVAIRTAYSRLDLAGASLRARERGVEMPASSRILFSVSEWSGIDHNGDAHFVWPRSPASR